MLKPNSNWMNLTTLAFTKKKYNITSFVDHCRWNKQEQHQNNYTNANRKAPFDKQKNDS